MSLPIFILLAVLLPLALVVAFYLFAQGTSWLAVRPRKAGIFFMVFGAFYVGLGVWTARAGRVLEGIIGIVLGVSFIIQGIYAWRRGVPQILE